MAKKNKAEKQINNVNKINNFFIILKLPFSITYNKTIKNAKKVSKI